MNKCAHKPHALPYLPAHGDAERRMEDGEAQVKCPVCQLWIWASRFYSPLLLWNALCGKSNRKEEK